MGHPLATVLQTAVAPDGGLVIDVFDDFVGEVFRLDDDVVVAGPPLLGRRRVARGASDQPPLFRRGGQVRIAQSQREQRVAAPLCPDLIRANGLSRLRLSLASPSPDCEGGSEQIGALGEDAIEEAGGELALLGVLHAGVEMRIEQSARHVFRDLHGVASDTDEGAGVQRNGLGVSHHTDHGWAFGQGRRQGVRG